jgi:hypothetical protein
MSKTSCTNAAEPMAKRWLSVDDVANHASEIHAKGDR